jgi:hypothetical protein
MERISINLLPQETAISERRAERLKTVKLVSISTLLVLFLFTSLLVTLRILQTRNINNIKVAASASEQKITQNKGKESSLVLLKDRLGIIDKLSAPSKQSIIYNSVVSKIPPSVSIVSVGVDSVGNLAISAATQEHLSLISFFETMTSDEVFKQIAQVKVDSLSKGRDEVYRASLKFIAKQ